MKAVRSSCWTVETLCEGSGTDWRQCFGKSASHNSHAYCFMYLPQVCTVFSRRNPVWEFSVCSWSMLPEWTSSIWGRVSAPWLADWSSMIRLVIACRINNKYLSRCPSRSAYISAITMWHWGDKKINKSLGTNEKIGLRVNRSIAVTINIFPAGGILQFYHVQNTAGIDSWFDI